MFGLFPRRGKLTTMAAALAAVVVFLGPVDVATAQADPAEGQSPGSDAGPAVDLPVVYLTFDSGPGPRTPEFLEVLDAWNAKATFFVIGRNAQNSPEMLAEIVRRGHAIGNHTWTHRDLTEMSPLEARTELRATNQFVARTVGLQLRCWRPPFAETTDGLIATAAKVGLSNDSWIPSGRWDVDTIDWKYGYEFVLARLQTIQAGDVVLMHGGMNPDHEDLAALMTWLETNGDKFRFETIPGCMPSIIGAAAVDATSPGTLAAVDPSTDYFATNPALWYQIQRGATYLSAFGPKP